MKYRNTSLFPMEICKIHMKLWSNLSSKNCKLIRMTFPSNDASAAYICVASKRLFFISIFEIHFFSIDFTEIIHMNQIHCILIIFCWWIDITTGKDKITWTRKHCQKKAYCKGLIVVHFALWLGYSLPHSYGASDSLVMVDFSPPGGHFAPIREISLIDQ